MQLKNCQSQENLAEDRRDGDACPNGSISPILDIAPACLACLACLASGSDQTWRAEGGQECPCRNLVKLHLTFLFTGFSISGKYSKRYLPPPDLRFVKKFTRPDFRVKNFTHQKCIICDFFFWKKQCKCIKVVFLLELNWVCKTLTVSVQNHTWCV